MNRLKHPLAGAFGDDASNRAKDGREQRQFLGAEMHGAVGYLTKKDRQKVFRGVDRLHERFDRQVELLVRGRPPGRDGRQLIDDRREMLADDRGVEGALVREVVIESSPC